MEIGEFITKHYDELRRKWTKYLNDNGEEFDDDIYHDTILKLMEKYENLNDKSEKGLLNYLFKSYTTNIKRERLYHRNLLRDVNFDDYTLNDFLDTKSDDSLEEKIKDDTYISFVTNQVLAEVSKHFDLISFRVFRIYMLNDITYKKLAEITNVKDVKKRITAIKKYIKENLDYKTIRKKFEEFYG